MKKASSPFNAATALPLVISLCSAVLMLWYAYAGLEIVWIVEPFYAVVRTFVRMFDWGVV